MNKILKRLVFSYFSGIFLAFIVFRFLLKWPVDNLGALILCSFFLALVVTAVTRFFYVGPLNKMIAITGRIGKRDFSHRLEISMHDELGDLALNLNQMADELQKNIQEITHDKMELQAILSSMVEGVIVIGQKEKILYLSPNFCSLLELRSHDIVGRPYWEVIRNQQINDPIKEAFRNRQALRKDISIIGPEETYFSMQISPVNNPAGELTSIVAVFHDITELKKYSKLRSDFVANVSHELKTPLTAIKGFVETLKSGALEDPVNARRFLDIIDNETQRLETLVTDLLTLSSLESKENKLEFQNESVEVILHNVIRLHKANLEKQHHHLKIDVPQQLPKIPLDRLRIEQVFHNLLDNAIKFTPPSGKLRIRVVSENGFIRIDVLDNGVGIPPEHLSRIFERFYRVDKARSRDLGGTGLGLSIVKHIVQAHQGKVSVKSAPGEGSEFSVYLPISS